jgi:hypothetical protein
MTFRRIQKNVVDENQVARKSLDRKNEIGNEIKSMKTGVSFAKLAGTTHGCGQSCGKHNAITCVLDTFKNSTQSLLLLLSVANMPMALS